MPVELAHSLLGLRFAVLIAQVVWQLFGVFAMGGLLRHIQTIADLLPTHASIDGLLYSGKDISLSFLTHSISLTKTSSYGRTTQISTTHANRLWEKSVRVKAHNERNFHRYVLLADNAINSNESKILNAPLSSVKRQYPGDLVDVNQLPPQPAPKGLPLAAECRYRPHNPKMGHRD